MNLFRLGPETADCRLVGALALLRVSLGAFLLVWAVMKLAVPSGTVGIFSHFYGVDIDTGLSVAFGVVQGALAVAIILGFARGWSYGLGILVHGFSQAASWRQTIDPWGLWLNDSPQMLFWTGVPVLAAFVALWLLRDRDAWSLDARRAAARPTGETGG